MRIPRHALGIAMLGTILGACAGPARSTLYSADDLIAAADEVRRQLASSEFLATRTRESGEIRLVPDRVENRSNDRLAEADRWAAVGRVLFDPGVRALFESKNVSVFLPPERAAQLERDGVLARGAADAPPPDPTHLFRAVFSSLTRADGAGPGAPARERRDTFVMEYSIVEFASGRIAWTGSAEFSRRAKGVLAD